MRRIALFTLMSLALIAFAACGSDGGGAATADTAPTAGTPASADAPPAAGGGCSTSDDTSGVAAGIENFQFEPSDVSASVGQPITWTNADSAPHTVTLDDGGCDTGNIAQNASAGLVFDAAGTYPFHCTIHPNMTGTITISQ